MYVVVFFLLIWALFQLNVCEAKCKVTNPDPSILYILQTKDDLHGKYNEEFIFNLMHELNLNDNIYYPLIKTPEILKDCSSNLTKTVKDTKNLRYVINLYVRDFYQTNYNDVKMYNLRWVGDIGNGEVVNVCRNNRKTKIRDMETCSVSPEHLKHAKLASEEVLDIPFLFDFVINFPETKTKVIQHDIVICTKEHLFYSNETLDYGNVVKAFLFRGYKSEICNPKFINIPPSKDNTIAIVAPNPECIQETNKPVIFYEEPYFRPEATAFFKNSILRTRSWKQMTDTILRFIWKMKWNRVAIISDNSVESEEFERELRSLFNEKGVSYIVETSGETSKCCDFNEALASLVKADARIIIANVGQQNAGLLAEQAEHHGLNYKYHLWIARDWSEDTTKEAAKKLYRVLSVYPQRTPIKMHLKAITDVIEDNWNNVEYDFFNEKQFARDIRKKLRPMDTTQFIITMTNSNGYLRDIGKYENGVGTFIEPLPSMPTDRNSGCSFKSTNYHKPCDDLYLIFFMMVVAIFSVTLLGITYFFETPDTPYNRMAN